MSTSAETLKEFTKEQIDILIQKEGRAIVIFEGDVFDTTHFKITHPGGPKLIDDHIGEDITELFYEAEHTKIALRLLNELKIGTLSKTADEQISHSTDHSHNKMKQIENESWRLKVDHRKGTIYQVYKNLNAEEYMKFINDPKHLTDPNDEHRMFDSDFMETFTRTPWYHIGLFWTPTALYEIWRSYHECSIPMVIMLFLFGIALWSFLEYALHRFIFHMEVYMPDSPIFRTIHYLFHGVHHAFPMDDGRLVFPILMAIPFYYVLHAIYSSILPGIMVNGVTAGLIFAYMMYDMGHHYLHHSQPLEAFEYRKKYHMYHHYKDPDNGYGITSSFWDRIFGTELDMSKKPPTPA